MVHGVCRWLASAWQWHPGALKQAWCLLFCPPPFYPSLSFQAAKAEAHFQKQVEADRERRGLSVA